MTFCLSFICWWRLGLVPFGYCWIMLQCILPYMYLFSILFIYIAKNGMARSYSNSTFSCLRNCQLVYNGCFTSSPAMYEDWNFSIFSWTVNTFLFIIVIFFKSEMIFVSMIFILVLVCMCLMTKKVEFLCLLIICVSSLVKCLYASLLLLIIISFCC